MMCALKRRVRAVAIKFCKVLTNGTKLISYVCNNWFHALHTHVIVFTSVVLIGYAKRVLYTERTCEAKAWEPKVCGGVAQTNATSHYAH